LRLDDEYHRLPVAAAILFPFNGWEGNMRLTIAGGFVNWIGYRIILATDFAA
jgi:hypothetical protein